jgi:hypothetical protein
MRVIRPDEFKKLAQDAVDAFLKRSVPLDDGLAKTALDNALNPEQVKNLVQLANTMAHLTLFDQKNDGDKIVEFDPADPATVIKKVFVNGEPVTPDSSESSASDPSDMFGDLGDVLDKVKAVLKGSGAAAADTPASTEQEVATEQPQNPEVSPAKRQMLIIKIRKVASELESKQHQAAYEYKDELDKLAADFAKLYGSDFNEFEKDAFALRGELAVPVIADLRHCLRLPRPVESQFVKTARVVDSKTREIRSLDKLIKLSDEWQTLDEARTQLKNGVGEYL